MNGHEDCMNNLLEKFSDKHSVLAELEDDNGNRPLHTCAINNEYNCLSILLEANCKLNPRNKSGQTPFMLAAAHNAFNIMELLFSDERSIANTNDETNTEVNDRIDIETVDIKGNSALHLALLNEHENCALFILDKIDLGSNLVNFQNSQGQTPLHLAASKGFLTCVEILLSKGADIWIKNKRQHTPLVSCAKNRQVADCLELMLSRLLLMSYNQQVSNNRANTTSNLMMMMMSGQKKTPPTVLKHRLRLNQKNNNSSHNNSHVDQIAFTSSDNTRNLNSTELKSTALNNQSETSTDNFQYNKINEQQNLNSTLIMNENVTSSGSSDENLNNIGNDNNEQNKKTKNEEALNKENRPMVVNEKGNKNENILVSNSVMTNNSKSFMNDGHVEQLMLDKIKPRSLSNNSNSSSDSDFY